MHCYIEFAKYPKWQTRELETSLKKQKKTIDGSPGTATNDPSEMHPRYALMQPRYTLMLLNMRKDLMVLRRTREVKLMRMLASCH
uniref:No apical meristem-associated C-terminal domain-containing protein n=1 Tax=Aegilops tauschii subsp. strangulata TaxID=200361 RepID=A0A453QFT5_AEGTS